MAKRINLNPRVLEKGKAKGHENEIMIIALIIFFICLFFYGSYEYVSYKNLMSEQSKLQQETQGLNFQQSNDNLTNQIEIKNGEIKLMNSLKENINYYGEIADLKKYEPEGIRIQSIEVKKENISITATATDSTLVPVFLSNLKKSKEYSSAFLENMQNKVERIPLPTPPPVPVKEIQKQEKAQLGVPAQENVEIEAPQSIQTKQVKQTVFSIQIGGNTNGAS